MQAKVRKVNDGEGQDILSRKGLVAEYLYPQVLFLIHLLKIYLYIKIRKYHLLSQNIILRREELSVTARS